MWHSDTKRREYQLRSLFDDVSFLSPVHEEDESFDSPRRPRTRSRFLPTARPYSPLPPLNIEVEKRVSVNKHDHPEEFYVRLEKRMKRIYRRLFIEGRNVSSDMSNDDDEDSNDDERSEERSYGNIDITDVIHDGGNIEPGVISNRSPKRRKSDDSSESDEEEIKAKKSRSTDSSSADVFPRSSSKEEIYDDETIASSIAEENGYETEDAMEGANVDIASIIAEDSIDENNNVERDDVEYTSESQDYIQVTFKADVHWAYSDEVNEPNDHLPSPASVLNEMGDAMDDDSGDDSENESVQDPDAAEEEIEESLENNAGNNASSDLSSPDRGDVRTTSCIQPDDTHDPEPAGEETFETLEKDEVPGNNAVTAPDRGDVRTTPCIQPDDTHDPEPAGEETFETLEKDEVQYNTLSAAPEREVEVVRSPLIQPSVGSLPEHLDSSHEEQEIDFEFLNRTQEVDDDPIEQRDAGTQTSFEETNGLEDLGNIFYRPRVFKLCRCRHHFCS